MDWIRIETGSILIIVLTKMSRINSSLGSGITIPLPQYRVKLINAESADHSNATKKGQSIDTDSIGYSNTAYAFFSFLEKRRKRWSILIIMKIFEKVYQGSKSLVLWMISRKNKSAERFKAESVTIISWSAVTKSCIAYEIWDLMSFEIWRLDQISDITEYSPKKKSESAITFPHNLSSCSLIMYIHAPVRTSYVHVRMCIKLQDPGT